MKRFNKRRNMLLAFGLGALLFTGAALAEINTPTGYEELKNAIKQSVPLNVNYESYTSVSTVTLKDNGKLLMKTEDITKKDIINNISESKTTTFEYGNQSVWYNYSDKDQTIHYSDHDDTWYVYKKTNVKYPINEVYDEMDFYNSTTSALEKVIDAGVAAFNLQNAIAVGKDSDGSTVLTIDLGEGQIHPFINAVFSFVFTQTVAFSRNVNTVAAPDVAYKGYDGSETINESNSPEEQFPRLEGDVFIKSVSGKIKLYEDKSIKDVNIKIVITGKEKNGTVHDFEAEAKANIFDINQTVINPPDLSDKKVVYNDNEYIENTISEAYIGKYKSDIMELSNNEFVKVGESYLEITKIEGNKLTFKTHQVIDGTVQNEKELTALIEGYNWASYSTVDPETGNAIYGSLSFRNNGTISYFDGEKEETVYTKIFE